MFLSCMSLRYGKQPVALLSPSSERATSSLGQHFCHMQSWWVREQWSCADATGGTKAFRHQRIWAEELSTGTDRQDSYILTPEIKTNQSHWIAWPTSLAAVTLDTYSLLHNSRGKEQEKEAFNIWGNRKKKKKRCLFLHHLYMTGGPDGVLFLPEKVQWHKEQATIQSS